MLKWEDMAAVWGLWVAWEDEKVSQENCRVCSGRLGRASGGARWWEGWSGPSRRSSAKTRCATLRTNLTSPNIFVSGVHEGDLI